MGPLQFDSPWVLSSLEALRCLMLGVLCLGAPHYLMLHFGHFCITCLVSWGHFISPCASLLNRHLTQSRSSQACCRKAHSNEVSPGFLRRTLNMTGLSFWYLWSPEYITVMALLVECIGLLNGWILNSCCS